jgi:hypothetical protein
MSTGLALSERRRSRLKLHRKFRRFRRQTRTRSTSLVGFLPSKKHQVLERAARWEIEEELASQQAAHAIPTVDRYRRRDQRIEAEHASKLRLPRHQSLVRRAPSAKQPHAA